MDCEKFEPLLIDELYGELDELTSAAVKRHVAGCTHCSAILQGMTDTRRAVDLPDVPLPAGLEDRIFAATREAQKVSPLRGRASRALSMAGNWAMRPQTAMAAVFLLMIGSSAFLLRSKREAAQSAAVSVTVAGEPAAPNAAADHDTLDDKAAAAAHGATAPVVVATMAAAPAAPPPAGAQGSGAGPLDNALGGGHAPNGEGALGSAFAGTADIAKDEAAPEKKKALEPAPAAEARVATQSAAPRADDAQDSFSAGMAAYRARNYPEATTQFDQAAQSGDANAALWAARTVRDGSGCASGLPRFEAVAVKAAGSWVGHEALLEAAHCQATLGQTDAARAKLTRLLGVPSHEPRARAALADLEAIAARGANVGPGAGGGAGKASRSAAPAPAPAAKPAKPAATAPADNH